jgi:hypothetical protein
MASLKILLTKYQNQIPEKVLNEYKNKQNFYLKGQYKMSINDIITEKEINIAKEMDEIKKKQYGLPCNNNEIMTIEYQNYLFDQIIYFLNLYNKNQNN